jgi:hypothetical protein
VFFLSLVFLVCILACYQEREALMKNSDELDCREFFKFKAVRRSVVFYCAFAFFSFLTVIDLSYFREYASTEQYIGLVPLPLAGAAFLILLLDGILSETSRETSFRLHVERRIHEKKDAIFILIFRLSIVALLLKMMFLDKDETPLRMPTAFLVGGTFFRQAPGMAAYLIVAFRELFVPKTLQGGDQKITAIRKILRWIGILLGAAACGLPFILWR